VGGPGDATDLPDARLVLHTQQMRMTKDGLRGRMGGVATAPSASALAVALSKIDTNSNFSGVRSSPCIGIDGGGLCTRHGYRHARRWRRLLRDADERSRTCMARLLNEFECKSAAMLATATAGAILEMSIVGNFGLTAKPSETITLDPAEDDEHVIRLIDDVGLAELRTIQVSFTDPKVPGNQWRIEQCALRETAGYDRMTDMRNRGKMDRPIQEEFERLYSLTNNLRSTVLTDSGDARSQSGASDAWSVPTSSTPGTSLRTGR
jgi:hypothetical protein